MKHWVGQAKKSRSVGYRFDHKRLPKRLNLSIAEYKRKVLSKTVVGA
jgi:hypothetical protein